MSTEPKFDALGSVQRTTDGKGMPCFALVANGMEVVDPYTSDCGCFMVDPMAFYGITPEQVEQLAHLNQLTSEALEASLNAVALSYQVPFGVTDGGMAGAYFSDPACAKPIYDAVMQSIQNEFGLVPQPENQTMEPIPQLPDDEPF